MRIWIVLLALCVAVPTGAVVAQQASKYVGHETCNGCHPDIHKEWSKTAHARAFDLLVNVGQQKTAECLPCHTTGYGSGGYVDEASTSLLQGVVCEACHGPGADHAGSMDKSKIQRVPSGKTCGACHQKSNIHSLPK